MRKTLLQQAADLIVLISETEPTDGLFHDLMNDAKALAIKLKKKPEKPTEEEIDEFNIFRREYAKGGVVNGCMVELNKFTKHEDWREVLPMLMHNLERQRMERQALSDSGGFVAQWRNLSTWINQRGWETVIFTIPEERYDLNDWYLGFLRRYISQKFHLKDIVGMALTEEQFKDYAAGKGYFAVVNQEWSLDRKREEFIKSHDKFFSDALVRQRHLNVGAYIKFKLTDK